MHDHWNAWFSFYTKGEIVSALLDLTILRATNGERSLDDVVRLLWEEYGKARRGLEEDAVERVVARVADVGDFFARYVDGTDVLPYEEIFSAAGLAFSSTAREPEMPSLTATVKSVEGLMIVERAIRGGAGMDAGLLPGDELLGLDGTRTANGASLAAALRGLRMGETAELLIARAGRVRRLSLPVRPDPRPMIALRIESPSEVRRAWLRRDE
jgi:predicted metalloprotease with PDZ domain